MLLENRSGELIGAWPIDGALISTVRRSSVIFIMCVGFSRVLSQSFCLESNSPSVCPVKTTNRDGFLIFRLLLKASNKPGRVALVCRIVSLRALATFIAPHPGAELVEHHGAEHRDPLAEHPERHPHGTLAALAPDPGITLGLKLGDSSVVCHAALKRDCGG